MKKAKKAAWIVILCISIAVVLGAAFFLFRYFTQQDIGHDDFKPTEAVSVPDDTTASSTEAPAQSPTETVLFNAKSYTMAQPENEEIDFDELMQINPDVYAWITIPGTNVDYPVAQSMSDGNDSFYLEHNIYRQYQFSGTIYSEVKNHTDFHDRVTVLYGHNMLNGSMFASLHYFEDPEFFENNNTIFVMTKDKVLTYLVYSAYTYDDRHILNSYNMDDDTVFQEYLDFTLDPRSYNGNVREGVELNTDNRILTLSTCTNGAANTRFLVQGVLVDERDR